MESGSGISAKVQDWTGSAGIGFNDLGVASLDAASVPINLTIDTSSLANFSESANSFAILNTTGGISNFNQANVTITAPGFAGTGTWSVASSSGSLVLSYTPSGGMSYVTWANTTGGIPGAPPSGDFDKDGLANLVEYALGFDPKVSSLPPGSMVGKVVTFTKGPDAKNDPAITYIIEQSISLSVWNEVVTDNNPSNPTVTFTLSAQPKDFARLKIKQN